MAGEAVIIKVSEAKGEEPFKAKVLGTVLLGIKGRRSLRCQLKCSMSHIELLKLKGGVVCVSAGWWCLIPSPYTVMSEECWL